VGAQVIVRGLRNVADFEYEHQIGWANSELAPDIELCCLFCAGRFAYLSATILKEVASLGGDVREWAAPHVLEALSTKFDRDLLSTTLVGRSDGKLTHRG
jgi:pantetheine-phosphate adenylyltransferase